MKSRSLHFFGLLFCICSSSALAAPNVVAWGWNATGACNVPPDVTNAIQVSSGEYHSLVLCADHRVVAWGRNYEGQCNVPIGLTNAVYVSAGFYHSVAVTADGKIVAWGDNGVGELAVPAGLSNVVSASASDGYTLALKADGTVAAWGGNYYGECNVPGYVTNVVALSAAPEVGFALQADGTIDFWGSGYGMTSWGFTNWLSSLTNMSMLASDGVGRAIGLTRSGQVVAGGINGDATWGLPAGLSNVIAVSEGRAFDVALKSDGTVLAWGANDLGQCTIPSNLPALSAISANEYHTLALVNMAAPPTLLSQPLSQTVPVGSTVFLRINVAGPPPLAYRWYFGTNLIVRATNSVLSLVNVQSSQSGRYSVVVSNPFGSSTSQSANLSIIPALQIAAVPAISLEGDVGKTYRLEFINSLDPNGTWTSLGTILITNTGQLFIDATALHKPARYYRITLIP